MPAADRSSFLADACGEDSTLRDAVETLLKHDTDDAFLESPAMGEGFHAGELTGGHQASSGEAVEGLDDIPGFKPIRIIGRGGDGLVYEAVQAHPHRRVAIKVLADRLASPTRRGRFHAEAEALADIDHPAVARVLTAGELESGRPWIAMELVAGVPLTQWVEANDPALRRRISLMADIARGVQAAHAAGIVHRDLKPENILITQAGEPKILDFGIARLRHPDELSLTIEGSIMGTIPWMSPEQASGTGAVDARSDVYSLGVLAYRVVQGEHPYDIQPDNLAASARIIAEQPPRPLRGPRDLRAVLMCALEKSPDRRYADAGALATDLQAFLQHRPVTARPDTAAYRLRQRIRRSPVIAGLLGVLVLVGIIASITIAIQRSKAAESSTARSHADYRAGIHQASDALDRGDAAAAVAALQACPESLRHWEWGWLLQRSQSGQTLPSVSPRGDAAVRETGEVLLAEDQLRNEDWAHARIARSGDVFAIDGAGVLRCLPRSGLPRELLDGIDPSMVAAMAVDSVGETVVVALSPPIDPKDPTSLQVSTRVLMIDAASGDIRLDDTIADRMLDTRSAISMSDGGRVLATCDILGGLTIWTLDAPATRRRIHVSQGPAAIDVSDDGETLAVGAAARGQANAWLLAVDTLRPVEQTPVISHDRGIVGVAVAPGGDAVASIDAGGTLRLTDVTGADRSWSRSAHPGQAARSVRFAASGWLLTQAADGTLKRWPREGAAGDAAMWPGPIRLAKFEPQGHAIVDAGGKLVRRHVPNGNALDGAVPSADAFASLCRESSGRGTRVTGDDQGRLTGMDEHGGVQWTLMAHTGPVRSVAVSSDGRRVLSVAMEGDALLHDAGNGALLCAIPWPNMMVAAVGFLDDSRTVALLSMSGSLRLLESDVLRSGYQPARQEPQ